MIKPKAWMTKSSLYLLIISTLIFSFCFLACNHDREVYTEDMKTKPAIEMAFDQVKWQTKDGKDYPYREKMLNAVLYNDSIRALNRAEILDLLGEPSYYRDNENFLYYTITQKRIGSWPLHTRSMVIKLTEGDTIEWIKIHE